MKDRHGQQRIGPCARKTTNKEGSNVLKTKYVKPLRGAALAAMFAALEFISSCAQAPPETIIIAGASELVGQYNGFFKDSDLANPANSSTLDISSPSGRLFTATLTITSGTDAPIAYVGEGTVSSGGIVSITAQNGEDTIDVEAEAATFDGGAATLDGTGQLQRSNTPDLDGTFILLRNFDLDPQNSPPSLDGHEYRGIRIGDDGSEGPITVQLSQSSDSNTLTGQGSFGLSSPPDSTTAQVVDDPPLTWSILGTVSNAGEVVWVAQTAEHRLLTVLHVTDLGDPAAQLSGSYAAHSFSKTTGTLAACLCPGYANFCTQGTRGVISCGCFAADCAPPLP
jgi:hypothetical protein